MKGADHEEKAAMRFSRNGMLSCLNACKLAMFRQKKE